VRVATSATFLSTLALATTTRAITPTSLTVTHTTDTSNVALVLHPTAIASTATEPPTTEAFAIVSTSQNCSKCTIST